ncbi:domain of unknown function (DUF1813) protein [Xanthomonas vesicatoria ATCC 35937]|uniref:Toxin SymE-like domain-containing protein n=1 Tax=Xanthomonas vesicatoria ATCC 35937 TaxID=925775 RepID=F0BE83_9XANT|nr:domain of unknown function (DUF1813) protein [Xanthomonas vesicatoria ATCC 35937]KTF35803.1 hypothetical protein LMG920_01540 [Xanthomonas vesicatoria]
MPHVRLSGLWLEQLGLSIGSKLRITASEGQLVMDVLAPLEVPAKARSVRRKMSPALHARQFVRGIRRMLRNKVSARLVA